MVGDFLRAQHDLVLEAVDFAVELVCRVGTERQRGSGGEHHPVGANQVQHAVLQHLGVGGQPSEWTVFETRHHSIGHVADPGLDRQQFRRQPAVANFVVEKFENMAGDRLRCRIRRGKGRVAVRSIGLDYGDYLLRVAAKRGLADPVAGCDDGYRLPVRRQPGAVVDVVHALQAAFIPELTSRMMRSA